jgi:ubiquinone/menaquinone biosynthesis C-methylase UbiE
MPAPPRRELPEFLDTPGQDPQELWGLLQDIRRTNQRFGGRRLILGYLERFLPALPGRPLRLLDVATASADIPCAIASWARTRGVPMRITALDMSADILAHAERDTARFGEITLMRGDAQALPFPDQTFDVVICALALHHFSFAGGVTVLREIDRVTRGAFVVNDVIRSWAAYAGAWLDTRVLTRNRLARHDGPLSVLRSFTERELREMAAAAEIPDVTFHRHPVFRVALVRAPAGDRA